MSKQTKTKMPVDFSAGLPKPPFTIADVDPSDFSRVPVHINHHEYDSSKPPVDPEFAEILGIPEGMNVGMFMAAVTPDMMSALLSRFNMHNRRMNTDRADGMRTGLENGTFYEGHYDPLCFSAVKQFIMSGQKRGFAIVQVGDGLHPSYGGYVWLLVAYGVDPKRRSIIDIVQPRNPSESINFLANQDENRALISTLNAAYFVHTTKSASSAASGNTDDLKRILGAARKALIWSAKLDYRTVPLFASAYVRLAFAELKYQHSEKADSLVKTLMEGETGTQPITAFMHFREECQNLDCKPFNGGSGGKQGVTVYRHTVVFLNAYLSNYRIARRRHPFAKRNLSFIPTDEQLAAGWDNNDQIKAMYTRAMEGAVPSIETIDDQSKIVRASNKTELGQATYRAQQAGVRAATEAFSTLKLISGSASVQSREKWIVDNVISWNRAYQASSKIYQLQEGTSREIQPSAISAFILSKMKDGDVDQDSVEFLRDEKNLKRIIAVLAVAAPRGSLRVPAKTVLRYLEEAYARSKVGQPLPQLDEIGGTKRLL